MSYCVAVEKEIATEVCPLARGKCMWQNRQTNKCCYSTTEDLEAYCASVGVHQPKEEEIKLFLNKLRTRL